MEFTEVPDYNYLRSLLKNIIKKSGSTIDFFYNWCPKKPNIKSDDKIFTNDYKIKYNGPHEWLNNFVPVAKQLNEDEKNDNEYTNKENNITKKNTSNNKETHKHHKNESTNFSTKCIDSDSNAFGNVPK